MIASAALSKDYELDVAFISASEMKKQNLIYRNIDKATDILSFPLSKSEGQIFICPSEARHEATKFDRKYANFILFLFIHGLVHLKGHDHGATMERIEARLRAQFGI